VPLLISFIGVVILINNSSTNQKEFVMKNLFLTCMVLFLVFTFGCQESSITDPTQPLTKNYVGADDIDDVNHNIIGLDYKLAGGSCIGSGTDISGTTYELSGQVKYATTTVSPGNIGKKWVNVRLEMVAQLFKSRGSEHPEWKIEKKTEDRVLLGNTDPQTKTLQKAYSITNRDDVELRVTYVITLKSVRVAEVFFISRDK
jgi:hypothetical protein